MSITEKIYEKYGHIRNFCAEVISCSGAGGEDYKVVLNKTAFFPEGGGQLADTGIIGNASVRDVQIIDGEIIHFTDSPLEIGVEYDCSLDWDKRFPRMQAHSGEHIVSGIIHKLFGYDNTGFHMGHDDITMDYNGILTEADIRRVEREANEAIYANVEITTQYPEPSELLSLSYRSKLDLKENVRLVIIGEYDICACCAPHVSRTGEIGIIKLLDFAKNKGGTRIHMLCGREALADYNERYLMISAAAQSLSVKQNALGDAIKRLESEIEQKKHKIYTLKQQLIGYKISEMIETDGNLCVFDEDLTESDMRKIMNVGVTMCKGICSVFSGNDNDGYSFTAGSKNISMRAEAPKISEALCGKCGGSDEMLRGSVKATKEKIEKYFCV